MPRLLPAVLIWLPFVFSTSTWGREPLRLQATQLQSLGIETAIAGGATSQAGAKLPARVQVPIEQMRVVSAPVAGRIEALSVTPGTSVRRGQVLAQLSSPQALELQREAIQASSQAMLANKNLKRDEVLFAEGIIAESRLQTSRAAAAQATAQHAERQQGLAMSGISSGKVGGALALTAPMDGVVLEQGAQLGQRVDAGDLIYRVARLSPLWLEIQVPLNTAAGLRSGMAVKAVNGAFSGQLTTITRAVDPASQSVLARATVSKGTEALIPGQIVEIELVDAGGGTRTRIPAGALARHEGKTYAFVQTDSDQQAARFTPRPVRIEEQSGSSVTVEGLRPGERIVVKGSSSLKAMMAGVGREE